MSTEQESSQSDVTPEISNAELDTFFETQGELPNHEKTETEENESHEPTQDENKSSDSEDKEILGQQKEDEGSGDDVSKHDRNYKAAMHEERERRKEAQQQLSDIKAENERLRTTVEKAMEHASQKPKETAPDFDEDPIAALKYENNKIKEELENSRLDREARKNQEEHNSNYQKFVNDYRRSSDEFAKTNPDFTDAYKHLTKARFDEHVAAGFTPEQANQMLHEDETAIVAQAFNQRVNPAERIYALAKLRGYQNNSNINKQNSNQTKMDQMEKGMRNSKSVNDGGSHIDDSISIEAVAAMSDSDFEKVDWDKIMTLG